ncbi:MAG: type III-A CRISPR-associated RAMP protein Csm5 [Treponema sp.]|jgi:CRISPR-associated protein Csm5|nr:type III-A CRISPR-associated RAMP protein Csm5 [Treponema sp.]
MAKQQYTVSIRPLTGVHIGTGKTLTPLDYKIATKIGEVDFKKPMYFKFSSDKILERLIAEQKDLTAFDRASVAGNMKELQKFFNDQCTEISDTDYPCDVTASFIQKYKENRSKDPLDNSAEVLSMYHTEGSPRPAIPGSSIKGSFRTAILNYLLADPNYRKRYDNLLHGYNALLAERNERFLVRNIARYEATMQKELLEYNDAKNDPFRCLSIADCTFKASGTQLTGLLKNISCSKTSGELSGLDKLQIQAEVLRGSLLGGKNVFAEMVISIDTDLQATRFPKDNKKTMPLSMQEIIESCNDFYWSAFQEEYDRFYKNSIDSSLRIIHDLKQALDTSRSKTQCIFRVGRWSQVEFVTFEENFRKPNTPKGAGNTRTVFDYDGQYVPMGWCVLSVKEPARQKFL